MQRRMSHLQALAGVAREAFPPPKRLLPSLFGCLAALRLCSDSQFWAQRREGGSGRAGQGGTAPPVRMSQPCAISACQRTGHGAVAKSDSLMFYVVT